MSSAAHHLTAAKRDDTFYEYVAGACKTKLVESFVDFNLIELLSSQPEPMSADEVAQKLGLHPYRTRKWLNVLSHLGLLRKILPEGERLAYGKERYRLTSLAVAFFGDKGHFYKDNINFHRYVNLFDFNSVLRGMPLHNMVRWPPQTPEAASHLEWWMTVTAGNAMQAIEKAVDMEQISSYLDAAGGEATMACAFAKKYPNLQSITVFNLPNSAALARANIERAGLSDRIRVVEIDFLSEEPFPKGFELVLWSRVLCDWPGETVRTLLRKTYEAVVPGGRVLITEPMVDGNPDLVIAWEFRYLFYDDFGVAAYKSRGEYEALLEDASFQVTDFVDRDEDSFYHSVVGTKR